MKCSKVLGISLVILAGWALGTAASSEPGWTPKRSLAQRGHLRQLLSEGERCWLGARVRRPRAAPQHHLFGVYPSSPGSYLRPYPVGDLGPRHAGRREPAAEGAAGASVSGEAERPPWAGDGAIGQSAPLRDGDARPDDGGSRPAPGEAGTPEPSAAAATVTTPFARRKEPTPGTRGEGRARTRRPRQAAKGQAEGVQADPGASPRRSQPLPKLGVRTSALEDSIQNGEADPSWDAEASHARGGRLPVLYFSGRRERLRLRPEVLAEIPREAFTVEAWVNPEGGQSDPAIITGNDPRRALRGPGGYDGFIRVG